MSRVLLVGGALLLLAGRAHGTYSVVGTDQAARQVGGAITSCVGPSSVAVVYGGAPGKGGINAQAAANAAGRDRGVVLLRMDVAPADIIRMITAPAFDPAAPSRQYGVVDLAGRAAGWTGANAQVYKEDRQGTVGPYTYSVQGNILTSKAVIDQAEAAFRTRGCDLADKLMLALEGGAQNGQGDRRCTTTRNIPSDSIFIEVDPEGMPAGAYLRIEIRGTGTSNPVTLMRVQFDRWRLTHPCGGPTVDGGTADADSGRDSAADGADAIAVDSADAVAADGADAVAADGADAIAADGADAVAADGRDAVAIDSASGSGGASGSGAGGTPASDGAGGAAVEPASDGAGCGCQTGGGKGAATPIGLVALLALLWRRRRVVPGPVSRRSRLAGWRNPSTCVRSTRRRPGRPA